MNTLQIAQFSCEPSIASPDTQLKRIRLLHVEDNDDDAMLCRLQLEEAGLAIETEVVTARDEFLLALSAGAHDVVLTDYKLPGWSGIEVLRLLAEDARQIPCILLTGSVGEEIAAKCMKLGATDYILKDRPTRLPFAIRSALQEREQRKKRREAELSRDRLAAIVECSEDAIMATSETGEVLSWNPGAAKMFGYASGEVIGTRLEDLFVADAGDGLVGFGMQFSDACVRQFETTGRTRSGRILDLAVTISPIFDAARRSCGCSAIVRDVTETKRQQKELLTTQKLEAIGQLAGGIAHDFNNLLTVINGFARMLQRKGNADPAKVDAILQAGERGQRLTKQLLLFSRKQITQLKPVDLNLLIVGFLNMLQPLIGAQVELQTKLNAWPASVSVDQGQMEQVIMNLVVNARDAMPNGGSIRIETRNVDSGVELSVTDTGMGMSKEVQARIFEPFFTTKEAGRGTGLGLSTSCNIIAYFKGQLRLESELGRGTTFTIELPLCAESPEAITGAKFVVERDEPAGKGTILLAEDDSSVRQFGESVLRDQGYHVLAAENGKKALEICAHYGGVIEALVTDVVMPEMNGRVLAEQARLMRPNLKILFVSGYVDRGLKDEDIASLSGRFLEKPFTREGLLSIVGQFCQGNATALTELAPNQAGLRERN